MPPVEFDKWCLAQDSSAVFDLATKSSSFSSSFWNNDDADNKLDFTLFDRHSDLIRV